MEQAAHLICACGCGGVIEPKLHHARLPPRFKHGHGRAARTTEFVQQHQGKHFCACGCGVAIQIKRQYQCRGIPRFLPRHHLKLFRATAPAVHKQNGRRRGRRPVFSFVDKVRLLRAANFMCACGCDDLELLQIDHVVPVWAGGSNAISNGQVLCVDCHTTKTSEDVSAYRKSLNVQIVMEA